MRELTESEVALIGGGEMQGTEGPGCTEPWPTADGRFCLLPLTPLLLGL